MNNSSEIISGADLISDSLSYFNLACDRFNNSNSSIYIISYLNIPLTVIVSTDFTLTLWIQLTSSSRPSALLIRTQYQQYHNHYHCYNFTMIIITIAIVIHAIISIIFIIIVTTAVSQWPLSFS